MENKRKIIVFERPNFFNRLLTTIYQKKGFDVIYFKDRIDFNIFCSANEYALETIDAAYESFFKKTRSVRIVQSLFRSDLICLAYKKIVLEKLLSFYSSQMVLNTLVKNSALVQIYYVPSEFIYFMKLARSCNLPFVLDKKIKIHRCSYITGFWFALFDKIAQIFLLACWPFVLIKSSKNVKMSKVHPEEYNIAVRIYKTGFNFKSRYRTIDFLLDGKDITKDNTLFCIETQIDKDFREELIRRKYHFVDIPDILREINLDFIKRIYFGLSLPAWLKLFIVSILEPAFIVYIDRRMLGSHIRWMAFLDRYRIKNFVVCNDYTFDHIIRNVLLSQKGIRTWYYVHTCHNPDLFTPPQADSDIRSAHVSYLYYENFVSWGKKLSRFYMKPYNNIDNFIHVGCLWSENIRRIMEKKNFPGVLGRVYEKYKQKGFGSKKIIGVFDTSFGGARAPLDYYDIKSFFEGILKLADYRKDLVFLIKPKKTLGALKEQALAFPYYREIKDRSDFYFLEYSQDLKDVEDSSWVNAICDLSISACFTSVANEALGFRKKAIYFDATNRFREYYYDRFPNLVAHGYDELVRLVDYWLYDIKDEEFSKYIDTYIKDEIDPYADGHAITRFRELLTN